MKQILIPVIILLALAAGNEAGMLGPEALGDSLRGRGDCFNALTEYLRQEHAQGGRRPDLALKQGLCYVHGGFVREAEGILEPILDQPGQDTGRCIAAHFGLAEVYLRTGQAALARFELNSLSDYGLSPAQVDQRRLHYALAFLLTRDNRQALRVLDSVTVDSLMEGPARSMRDLIAADQLLVRLNPEIARLKALVPGWGQWYAGRPGNAANAFLLNGALLAGLAYSAYRGSRNYRDGGPYTVNALDFILVYSLIFSRYYSGGRDNAYRFAREHNQRLDEELQRKAEEILWGIDDKSQAPNHK
jgi:hypothetical protein